MMRDRVMSGRVRIVMVAAVVACMSTRAIAADSERPIPDVELEVRVEPSVIEVEFGVAFNVTIVRVWHQAFDVDEASLDAFEPLEVTPRATSRRSNATHVEETLVFECRSFEVGEVLMPPPLLIATDTDTGEQRIAFGEEWSLDVQSSLPADNPGAIELPSGMLAEPRPWLPWVVRGSVALVVLVLVTGLTWRSVSAVRRRRSEEAERALRERPPSPYEKASARLARLRERDPSAGDAAALEAWALDAAWLLRDYLRDGFGALHDATTTEEFVSRTSANERFDASERDRLRGYFTRCDAAKFGNRAFDADERRRLLDTAAAILDATRERASGEDPAPSESQNGNGTHREVSP